MKQRTTGQQLELPPAAQYGRSQHAVSIRLIGVTEADVQLQVDRLVILLGALYQSTAPRQSGRGPEWIAYGSIVG